MQSAGGAGGKNPGPSEPGRGLLPYIYLGDFGFQAHAKAYKEFFLYTFKAYKEFFLYTFKAYKEFFLYTKSNKK
jgi:hypothetical protein